MANETGSAGRQPRDPVTAPGDEAVPAFLHEHGFAGILARAGSALRADIAAACEVVGLPAWGPGRMGLVSKLLDGPMSQVQVAKFLRISPPSAMELVKRLERDGFVKRQWDQQDARRRLVSLTPATARKVRGLRRVLAEGMQAVEAHMVRQGFTDADLQRCKALLRAYTDTTPGVREHYRAGAADDPPASATG